MSSAYSWLSASTGLIIGILGVVLAVLIGLVVWLAVRLREVEQRYRDLATGTSGGNLEHILHDHVRQVREARDRAGELEETVRRLERTSRHHVQHIGVLRFNPFRDSGGDQSFAVALTDGDGNGVVISSLHGRDATRVYAKPLAAWESVYPLTDEEKQAIRQSRGES